MLDVYLIRPRSSFIARGIVQWISDLHRAILEVEWEENCCVPQVERLVPVYHKTDALGLQNLLLDKFGILAGNGSILEEIWNMGKQL